MATFYFVLGMVVVLVIAEVIAAFIITKTIISLKERAEECEDQFNGVHRRIDDINREQSRDCEQQFGNIHNRIDDVNRDTDQKFQEVWRQLDSRLDKLETRLTTKQVIKG